MRVQWTRPTMSAVDHLTACARVRWQACAPLMRLFGECTKKHGMWAVVWSCRAENIAMNECMKEECVSRAARATDRLPMPLHQPNKAAEALRCACAQDG